MRSILLPALIPALFAVAPGPVVRAQGSPPMAHWEAFSRTKTLDGEVLTMMRFGDDLIVGGRFTSNGGALLNHVGAWDGTQWHSLGDGFDYPVSCLGTYRGDLIAGGWFTESGGRAVGSVARWNGTEWEPLGSGFSSAPRCFVEWNGGLVAGGTFHCQGGNEDCRRDDRSPDFDFAAFWDGTAWTPMGTVASGTALSSSPRDLIVYEGTLYAAGRFDERLLEEWNGSAWTPAGPRVDRPYVLDRQGSLCVAVWNGLLVVGGDFTSLDSTSVDRVVAFDGEAWIPMGGGEARSVLDFDVVGDRLYLAGDWSGIQQWDGASWSRAIPDGPLMIRAFAVYKDRFYWTTHGDYFGRIWGSGSGDPLEEPGHLCRNPVWALVGFDDRVIYNPHGSTFFTVENLLRSVSAAEVHQHHGTTPLWDIYDGYPSAVYKGKLVTGRTAWDGTGVEDVPGPPALTYLRALFVHEGTLIAAGGLPRTEPAGIISAWDGQEWQPFGEGFLRSDLDGGSEEWPWSQIDALATYGGRLVAGGLFEMDSRAGRNVAAWNGTVWTPLGEGPDGMVTCLAVYGDDLIAGGFFGRVGKTVAPHVARWNGSTWSAMGTGTDGPVYALALYNGRLIAGGDFDHAGGRAAGSVAAWDGTGWVPLGSGVDGEVLALAVDEGSLIVGGEFSRAGGQTSFHLARWEGGPGRPSFSTLTARRTPDGVLVQVAASSIPFDHHGFVLLREDANGEHVPLKATEKTHFSMEDLSPPRGAVTYWIAGLASTGAVIEYESIQAPADPELRFALFPASPNPFQARTRIDFDTARRGPARVAVFDVRGRMVADLLDRRLPVGSHSVTWDGRDMSGRAAAAGTYFLRLSTVEGVRVQRIVCLAP